MICKYYNVTISQLDLNNTVTNGSFGSVCARSIDAWDNESGFYQQGYC